MLLLKCCDVKWPVQGHTAGIWWRGLLASIVCPQSTVLLFQGSSCLSSPPQPSFLLWAFPESQHYDTVRALNRGDNEGALGRENRWANRFLCLLPISPQCPSPAPLPPKKCFHGALTSMLTDPWYFNRWQEWDKYFFCDHLTQCANKACPKMSVSLPSIPTSPTLVLVIIFLLSSNSFDFPLSFSLATIHFTPYTVSRACVL